MADPSVRSHLRSLDETAIIWPQKGEKKGWKTACLYEREITVKPRCSKEMDIEGNSLSLGDF